MITDVWLFYFEQYGERLDRLLEAKAKDIAVEFLLWLAEAGYIEPLGATRGR